MEQYDADNNYTGAVLDPNKYKSWGLRNDENTVTYDNLDGFFQNGGIWDSTISVAGGNDSGNFYLSGSYFDQDGVVKRTGYTKTAFRFNGEQRWISVRLLTDARQMPNEAVLCFRDVEAEKEQQQQQVRLLKGALAAAEQSERSQKQFFSVMSHDMRTPLNIIIGITNLALQPGDILGIALGTYVGQNLGAGRLDRARPGLGRGTLGSLRFGPAIGWFSFFHGMVLTSFFNKDPIIAAAGAEYLKAYAIDCLLTAFLFPFFGYFNGRGSTGFVMLQELVGAFGVRIPVSFFMSRLTPVSLFQVGLATPCSTLVQIILCGGYFFRLRRKDKRMDQAVGV